MDGIRRVALGHAVGGHGVNSTVHASGRGPDVDYGDFLTFFHGQAGVVVAGGVHGHEVLEVLGELGVTERHGFFKILVLDGGGHRLGDFHGVHQREPDDLVLLDPNQRRRGVWRRVQHRLDGLDPLDRG